MSKISGARNAQKQAKMAQEIAANEKREAAAKAAILQDQLSNLEANRQEIINPYDQMQNEYANLGVATQASEFQAEEADIALANTLDAMVATGAGAGGATALAQAALQSKRGISQSLEKQEVNNQKLAADGAATVSRMKAEGRNIAFNNQETRELQKLDRTSNLLDQQTQRQQNMEDQEYQAGMNRLAANGNMWKAGLSVFGL
jgi:hypothetical protein